MSLAENDEWVDVYLYMSLIFKQRCEKPFIKLPDWRKHPMIAELWVVYGYYFFFLPIQDPYILHVLQAAHIYSPYHGHNY